MRIYLPATPAELVSGTDLDPRDAHAVTPALRAALPDEDQEGLEFSAQLAAADSVLALLAAPEAGARRLVVTADVPAAHVAAVEAAGDPTVVRLVQPVSWAEVVCVHVDEREARADVVTALDGDAAATERLAERDLLWYDAAELDALAAELRADLRR